MFSLKKHGEHSDGETKWYDAKLRSRNKLVDRKHRDALFFYLGWLNSQLITVETDILFRSTGN